MKTKIFLIIVVGISLITLSCDEDDYLETVKNPGGECTENPEVWVDENLELYNYYNGDMSIPLFLATRMGEVYTGSGNDNRIDDAIDVIFLGDTLCSSRYLYDRNPSGFIIQKVHHTAFKKIDITNEEFDNIDTIDEIKQYIPHGEAENYKQCHYPLSQGDFIAFLCCLRHGGIMKIEELSQDKIVLTNRMILDVD